MASELTKIIANFQTTLAAKVTAGDVAGTIAGNTDKEGNALPTGVYGFTINEGKSNEQHIKCLLTGTAMTVVKGITHAGVESTGFLKDAGINSPIKITDFVNILRIVEILNGTKALDSSSPMKYDAEFSVTDRKQVITAGYAQDLLSGAVGSATDLNAGTNKMTHNQGLKPRAKSTLVREQDTPDKTLKVEAFRYNFADTIYNYAGGNTPNFIDPAFGGDLSIALQPANGETVVVTVDGVATTLTFVTTIGATPGNILIGASAATARANLVAFINNPTVTSATQVAVTGTNLTAIQKLSATDDASLNAFIRAINPAVTSFSVTETMAGVGNIWTANTTKNRIDLVVVDNTNTLQIRKGSEAVSPTNPTPSTGDLVICSVYNKPGETTILDRTSGGSGYINEWYDLSVYRTDIAKTSDVSDIAVSLLAGENINAKDALAVSGTIQTTPITLNSKAGGNVLNNTSLTYALTVGNNTNRALIVAVGTVGGTSSVTSVTYGGQAMTKIQDIAGTNNGRGVAGSISLWKLVNPPTGANNVVVTQSSAVSMGSYAYSFYNVDQASGVDVSGGQTTNTSYSLTTTGLCDVLINFSTNFAGSGSPSSLSSLTFGGVNAVGLTDNSGYAGGAHGITAGYSPVAQTQGATTISLFYVDNSYMTASVGCALKPVQSPVSGVVKTDATSASKIGFIGFAKAGATSGNNVAVQVAGLVTGLSGLTTGTTYFLSNTPGALSTTAGSNSKKVGLAASATSLLIRNDNA